MIKKLPEEVIKKISAGEVVENPASCVRELIENSLDAGATNIRIAIEGGGIDYIEVSDNGVGIPKDEIKLAVERFTTSKISDLSYLKSIKTLGFRGEALYAISQVSNLIIRTNTSENFEEGWECHFNGGTLVYEGPYPHDKGTTVIVKDLFFNFPARRKFLLSKREEGRRILNEIIAYALWHQDVSFEFIENGEKVLDLKPGDFGDRVLQVLGKEFIDRCLFVMYDDKHIKALGFISKPETLSISRHSKQILLINGRGVKSEQIKKAIFKAYDRPTGNPDFVFRIEINPEFVDFNIHPQKKEVKIAPYLRFTEKISKIIADRIQGYKSELGGFLNNRILDLVKDAEPQRQQKHEILQLELGEMMPSPQQSVASLTEEKVSINLWQAYSSYIFAQTMSGIMIIDQHAAHERILYDKLKKKQFSSQTLLFPILVQLTPLEKQLFDSFSDLLNSFGFEFRYLDNNSLVFEKVPSIFKSIRREDLKDMINSLEEAPELPARLDNLIKTIACKAAVKFGDTLSREEMSTLIDELFTTDNPFNCPHGRPTIYFISLEELKSKFER
ncbi:MAG: DNA mismatch repair endonuclease MutL [Candidatus Hydrothermia bacterium]